ncbi:DivIVA domain-containing protein [Micromonospora sp. WMMA1363]|uniref:DivIVA domain-containing protein n=1 Tax=Micromonospora sp. WMMA1363 TaxID=3053985 RepID=UPI00259CC509|nr:DivIVA domain-containing protein [Micromonospora sp. WMMA1363]MDM4722215.1 DivIVA domain-containing protein [Micromonospora sp. WMMA1363]
MTRRHHAPHPTPIQKTPTNHIPLRPWQVRDRCFTVRRRGVDPVEIRAFLHRVADELAVAQRALVAVQEENVRIKNALRAWQSAQSANHRYR